MTQRIQGVLAPVLTPFKSDYSPDAARLIAHCKWLIASGSGLALFGTNSEANSLTVDERMSLLDQVIDAGVDPARIMPGTGCCAAGDTVRLSAHAVSRGCAGVLMLPPFYYKGVSDEGLFRSFANVIERVNDDRLRVYLYHIPPVAQVGISAALIDRLLGAYPGIVAGMKDSSGDWANIHAMLEAFAPRGFDVFVGSEMYLLASMKHGAKGAISAAANIIPGLISTLHRTWQAADAEAQQARLDAVRAVMIKQPMLPALKRVVAHWRHDDEWARVRPPLVERTASQAATLVDGLQKIGFDMPGV